MANGLPAEGRAANEFPGLLAVSGESESAKRGYPGKKVLEDPDGMRDSMEGAIGNGSVKGD